MGKTSLMARMIVQDIAQGEGVCLIDPNRELAEQILNFVPESRVKEVVYFNPADREYPFVFNLFDDVQDESELHILALGIVGILNDLWRDVWTPRLEYVLTNSILTLLANKGTSFLDIVPLLTDETFRNFCILAISDNALREFWTREFSEERERFLRPAIEPIRDKMGQLLTNPVIRNTSRESSRFSFNDLLDKKRITICSFNKHEIGEDAARLLGSAFLLRLLLRAKRTAPSSSKRDLYLYIDEFHELAFNGISDFLGSSEHGLRFIVSHQYLSQINENLREAIFGNVGTILAFRVGSSDAAFLAEEFGPTVSTHNLTTLPPYMIILKLLINGKPSSPFSALTLPPLPKAGLRDRIVSYSRMMYGEQKSLSAPESENEKKPEEPKKSLLKEFREKIAAVTRSAVNHDKESDHKRMAEKSEELLQELSPGKEVGF